MLNKPRTAMLKTAFILRTLFYWLCVFYWELIMRLSSIDSFFSFSLVRILLLSLPLGMVLATVFTLVSEKRKRLVLFCVLGFLWLLYCSQIVYCQIFHTFWVLGSVENGADAIFQFFGKMISSIIKCTFWIELNALAVFAAMKFEKRVQAVKPRKRHYMFTISTTAIAILFTLLTFVPATQDKNSALGNYYGRNGSIYQLYEKSGVAGALGLQVVSVFTDSGTDSAIDSAGDLSNLESDGPPVSEQPTTDDPDAPPTGPTPITYNVLDIDFEQLAADAENDREKQLHEYFANITPSAKNDYTGMFEGYNLIMLTAESFAPYAVDKELTPTLYKMVNEGFKFTNFYNPPWAVSTSDGEYVSCVGLFPKPDVWSFYQTGNRQIWLPFTMGRQYEALGVQPYAYHNNTHTYYRRHLSHPNMGYIFKAIGSGLEVANKNTWPQSDLEMVELTVDDYITMPMFHAYYMTVSGHMEYNWTDNMMASRNRWVTDNMEVSERLKAYFACNFELEKAMTYLMERLREAGVADRTLIVISPDHYPYGLTYEEIEEFLGHEVERDVEVCRSTLIMYVDGMEPVTIDKPCSNIDIIPTISNLLGLPYDSRLLMGTDILSDSPSLVCFDSRSFITDKGTYYAKTGEFVVNEGETVDEDYRREVSKIVAAKFAASEAMLDLDYYRLIEPLITGSKHMPNDASDVATATPRP